MNNQVEPSIIKMEQAHLKQLLTQVEETIATDKQSNFSVVDLWKIQRNMKPALRAKLNNRWHM